MLHWGSIHELNLTSILLRTLLAMIVGGLLGMERGLKNRPAGFRTYMLVCVASATVMMTNEYMHLTYGVGDVGRMGAQVVSGMGFLGAGAIIVTKRRQVSGITTAASLWASACLGLAIGIGFYAGAIIGILALFVIMMVLTPIDMFIKDNTKELQLYVEVAGLNRVSPFLSHLREEGLEILDWHLTERFSQIDENTALVVILRIGHDTSSTYAMEVSSQAEGVRYIEEM